jgi:hypothetical protein
MSFKERFTHGGKPRHFATARDFERQNDIAYGMWTTKTGREVLFNRFYEPIWERQGGDREVGPVMRADGKEWVADILTGVNFYNDGHTEKEKRQRGLDIMRGWGIDNGILK